MIHFAIDTAFWHLDATCDRPGCDERQSWTGIDCDECHANMADAGWKREQPVTIQTTAPIYDEDRRPIGKKDVERDIRGDLCPMCAGSETCTDMAPPQPHGGAEQ